VLDPSLFGGSPPPHAYVTMLESCSRQAAMLLAIGWAERMIATELVRIHAAVAGPAHFDASLQAHVDWLQRVTAVPAVPAVTVTEVGVRDEPATSVDYASPGAALRACAPDPDRLVMFASRLAHLQAVRLRGPDGGVAALLHEAATVRALRLCPDAPVPPSP
jgi:hypothetical protein